MFISEFTTNIEHTSGKSNVVADCLSRIGSITPNTSHITPEVIREAQRLDPEWPLVQTSLTGLKWADIELTPGVKLSCDVSCGRARPWVPSCLRKDLFVHSMPRPTKDLERLDV